MKNKRTKKGLITHELTSVLASLLRIDKIIKGNTLEKELRLELDRIELYINNIDTLVK